MLRLLSEVILHNGCKRCQQRASSLWPFWFSKTWYPLHIWNNYNTLFLLPLLLWEKRKKPLSSLAYEFKAQTALKFPLKSQLRVNFALGELHRGNQASFFCPTLEKVCPRHSVSLTLSSNVVFTSQVAPNYSVWEDMDLTIKWGGEKKLEIHWPKESICWHVEHNRVTDELQVVYHSYLKYLSAHPENGVSLALVSPEIFPLCCIRVFKTKIIVPILLFLETGTKLILPCSDFVQMRRKVQVLSYESSTPCIIPFSE